MPVATSIVMDVVSFAWSRAVSLRVGALEHTSIRAPVALARGGQASGHPGHTQKRCANEATTGRTLGLLVMLFQDVVFG